MSNIVKINNKQNNIFLENEGSEIYKIIGIEINNKIFIFESGSKLERYNYVKDKKVIYFRPYIYNLIINKVKEQLRLYITQNINNYDLYKRNRITDIISNLGQNVISDTYIRLCDYNFKRIRENKINMRSYDINYVFDIEKNILDIIKNNKKTNLLNVMFDQTDLDYAVAQEQYKRGLAPNIVYELNKINEFVKGKYSIKVILNDNTYYTVKKCSRKFFGVSDIFSYDEDLNLKIYKSYIVGERDKSNRLQDIKAFKYGQVILPIEHEKLKYEIEYKIKKKVA